MKMVEFQLNLKIGHVCEWESVAVSRVPSLCLYVFVGRAQFKYFSSGRLLFVRSAGKWKSAEIPRNDL